VTLYATRDGQQITLHGNTGVHVAVENSQLLDVTITEHATHLRHFWGQLGSMLEASEIEAHETAHEHGVQHGHYPHTEHEEEEGDALASEG
jgi:hypothetical protein